MLCAVFSPIVAASMAYADNSLLRVETPKILFSADLSESTPAFSLVQRPPTRELLAETDGPLFRVALRKSDGTLRVVSCVDARSVHADRIDGGFRVVWSDFNDLDLDVRTTFTRPASGEGIDARIELENRSGLPVESVGFPILTYRLPLDENDPNEAVVFPRHEGILLQRPHDHFTEVGTWENDRYAGHIAFQFMGYYDSRGGVYVGAHDAAGCAKEFRVRRGEAGLELTVVHLGLGSGRGAWSQPYPVVLDTFEGDWMAAADLYREWARRQFWCAKPIAERDVPRWLYEGVGFFNYPAQEKSRWGQPMPFFPPTKASEALGELGDALGVPFVATPFSWEKNGIWIGPDYFPPRGGSEGYRQLAESLRENGDRLFVFLSGFRWGIAKPGNEYDGSDAFARNGNSLAVRDRAGEVVIDERPWAKNVLLCAGNKETRKLLAGCFEQAYSIGIDGVQLDQDVGGEVYDCYSTDHGHPPGPGRWQAESMAAFLKDVRQAAKKTDPDRIMSVEEPCEFYVPHLDVYHGRSFTYTHWPAVGKGAVSVPVFIYLYHPYLLGYAGWTGGGFDLENNVELSIGRAFIFGVLVGVRANVWTRIVEGKGSRTAFEMWRQAIHLQRRCPEALLWGDMTRPPRLRGIRTRSVKSQHSAVEARVESVQATAWLSREGVTWYALANVEGEPAEIEVQVLPSKSPSRSSYRVVRVREDDEVTVAASVSPGDWVALDLAPYELACLRVDRRNRVPSR